MGISAPEEPQDRKIKNPNPCILDQAWRMLKRLEIPIRGVVRREQESLRETVQKSIFPGLFLKNKKPGLCNRMRDGWDADQIIEGGLVAVREGDRGHLRSQVGGDERRKPVLLHDLFSTGK